MTTTSKPSVTPLTADRLRELLSYDHVTGVFTWLQVTSPRVRFGEVAGSISSYGYRRIKIDGQDHMAHLLAWLYVHGVWPESDIDHKDTHRDHNWIDNLRPASRSQNIANSRLSNANTSGFKGVSYYRRKEKWIAKIGYNGRSVHLGYFDTPEEAHLAYVAASERYFGDFANRG